MKQGAGGGLEVICGSMFSGKSEELIRRVRRAEIARQKVQVFKPAMDTRYGHGAVTAHSGATRQAVALCGVAELEQALQQDTTVVAIDEVQFFEPSVVDLCRKLADTGVRVIVATRQRPGGPHPGLSGLRAGRRQRALIV